MEFLKVLDDHTLALADSQVLGSTLDREPGENK